jgi:phosphohistidine phosphatase SixA
MHPLPDDVRRIIASRASLAFRAHHLTRANPLLPWQFYHADDDRPHLPSRWLVFPDAFPSLYPHNRRNRMLRLAAALILLVSATMAQATEAGWALLRDGGHVVLLRHAMVTGSGDSAGFDIEKCATQQKLSERGKQQARKIGALFAARAAPIERVLSSRYCRALDTATTAFDKVEAFEPLDLLSKDAAKAGAQNAAVLSEIENYTGDGNLIFVTHLENIKALTGAGAREGEAVIVGLDGDALRVLARIIFN